MHKCESTRHHRKKITGRSKPNVTNQALITGRKQDKVVKTGKRMKRLDLADDIMTSHAACCVCLCVCLSVCTWGQRKFVQMCACCQWELTNPPDLSSGKIFRRVPAQPTSGLLVWLYLWAASSLWGHSLPSSALAHAERREEWMVGSHRTMLGISCSRGYIIRLLVPLCSYGLNLWGRDKDALHNISTALLNECTHTLETVESTLSFYLAGLSPDPNQSQHSPQFDWTSEWLLASPSGFLTSFLAGS